VTTVADSDNRTFQSGHVISNSDPEISAPRRLPRRFAISTLGSTQSYPRICLSGIDVRDREGYSRFRIQTQRSYPICCNMLKQIVANKIEDLRLCLLIVKRNKFPTKAKPSTIMKILWLERRAQITAFKEVF